MTAVVESVVRVAGADPVVRASVGGIATADLACWARTVANPKRFAARRRRAG